MGIFCFVIQSHETSSQKNLLHPNFQMFHFTQTKQSSHCWGSKSKQLLFFDTIMSLCLQEFTYSTAFPAPPKDPMGLSEEENALVFRFEPKQQNEARPYHFSNQNFETQVSWDLLDWQVASSLEAGCQDRCSWSLTSLATMLWEALSIARQG